MKQLNKRKEIEKYEEIEIKQKNKSNEIIVEERMKGEEIKLKKENLFQKMKNFIQNENMIKFNF